MLKKAFVFFSLCIIVPLFSLNAGIICKSGGKGSSSCSMRIVVFGTGVERSVTCEEGYYACCDFSSAGCVKENQNWLGRKWDKIWA